MKYENELTAKEIERFRRKVDRRGPDECWPWLGDAVKPGGHGKFSVQRDGRTVKLISSRCAYALEHGHCPQDLDCCHTCDNPPCSNPAHLFTGTARDNIQDAIRKGRMLVGERNGQSRLTDHAVRRIFTMRQLGIKQRVIALAVDTRPSHISLVLSRQIWAHVTV